MQWVCVALLVYAGQKIFITRKCSAFERKLSRPLCSLSMHVGGIKCSRKSTIEKHESCIWVFIFSGASVCGGYFLRVSMQHINLAYSCICNLYNVAQSFVFQVGRSYRRWSWRPIKHCCGPVLLDLELKGIAETLSVLYRNGTFQEVLRMLWTAVLLVSHCFMFLLWTGTLAAFRSGTFQSGLPTPPSSAGHRRLTSFGFPEPFKATVLKFGCLNADTHEVWTSRYFEERRSFTQDKKNCFVRFCCGCC